MNVKIRTTDQLAKVIQDIRKQKGLTQKQITDRVGLLAKTISALENSPNGVSIASLFKLLSALDLEITLQPKVLDAASRGEW